MLRGLILLSFLFLFITACATNSINRNIASDYLNYDSNEKVYLSGLRTYFPTDTNYQVVTLNNRYEKANIKYKIVSSGNIVLSKDKGTCKVSGQEGTYSILPAQSSCEFYFRKTNTFKDVKSEIRVYQESDSQNNNGEELIISEVVYLNTFTENQCKTLIESTLRTQNPDTLHEYQCTIINNSCKPKPKYVKDCQILDAAKLDDHNSLNLYKYCINNYYPDTRKQFINSEDGSFDQRAYQDYVGNLAGFDVDNYCQDTEE